MSFCSGRTLVLDGHWDWNWLEHHCINLSMWGCRAEAACSSWAGHLLTVLSCDLRPTSLYSYQFIKDVTLKCLSALSELTMFNPGLGMIFQWWLCHNLLLDGDPLSVYFISPVGYWPQKSWVCKADMHLLYASLQLNIWALTQQGPVLLTTAVLKGQNGLVRRCVPGPSTCFCCWHGSVIAVNLTMASTELV